MKKNVASAPRMGELFIREAMRPDYEPDPDRDLRQLMRLWLTSMPQGQRDKMEPAIVEYFGIIEGLPVDTALRQLRDLVNSVLQGDVHIKIIIGDGNIDQEVDVPEDEEKRVWLDALNAAINMVNFRLCEQCGKPFTYKREDARLCSNACRVRSSRAKTG